MEEDDLSAIQNQKWKTSEELKENENEEEATQYFNAKYWAGGRIANGQVGSNGGGNNENSNQEQTEYDNVEEYVMTCTHCGKTFKVKKYHWLTTSVTNIQWIIKALCVMKYSAIKLTQNISSWKIMMKLNETNIYMVENTQEKKPWETEKKSQSEVLMLPNQKNK